MPKLPYSGLPLDRLLAGQTQARRNSKPRRQDARATPPELIPLFQRGTALQLRGELGLAAQLYRAVLERHPNNPDALHLLGTVALAEGHIDPAIGLCKRAVAGKPADPAIRVNLANAFLQKDDAAAAELHLRKALKLSPDHAGALCFLADCRASQGDEPQAKHLYETLLSRLPEHPQALIGYADLCVTLGEVETARALYRRALGLGTVSALALAGLASCEHFEADSPEAAALLRELRNPRTRPAEYVNLSYAAGKIAEDAGDYLRAFTHFTDAKRASGVQFDLAAHRHVFETLKSVFTPAFFAARSKLGDPSARPVFIVGMPRSGTTLVEQILSRHPEIAAGGELGDITRIAASLGFRDDGAAGFAKRLSALAPTDAKALARDYLAVLRRVSPGAARVTDKMPHNFQHLGLIALLFPNARIIHCRRDPLDTCVSCFTTQLKAHNHAYAADLATLGSYYREYFALMDHWRAVLPAAVHDLDYERLIASPEEESRRLVAFVGLDWDSACLSAHLSARPVSTQSRQQVRQPLYATSIGRSQNYHAQIAPLREALGDLAEADGDRGSRG